MECDVQTLISANPCLAALSPRMLRILQAQMLCGIFNNLDSGEPITCDIQALLDDAECFNELNDFQLEVAITQLLCEISGLL
jgi:hypothetical protein